MKGLKHRGGERVQKGTYWNITNGERVNLDREGLLPGDRKATYYRGHPLFVLLAAPVLGMVYAVFLPFIGIASVVTLIGRKLFGGMAHEVSKAATFGWRPVEAYLAGKKGKKAEKRSPDAPEQKTEG